jgi:beta-galactosidase
MPFVDWQQFRKANMGVILREWREYIKAVDAGRPTIADNINSMVATDAFYSRPHDDWNVAENVDEYGISFYPKENLAGTPATSTSCHGW